MRAGGRPTAPDAMALRSSAVWTAASEFAHLEDLQALSRSARWWRLWAGRQGELWGRLCRRQYSPGGGERSPPAASLAGAYRSLVRRRRCHLLVFDGERHRSPSASVYEKRRDATRKRKRAWQCSDPGRGGRTQVYVIHPRTRRVDAFVDSSWRRGVRTIRWHAT